MRLLVKLFIRFTGFIITAAVLLCAYSAITAGMSSDGEDSEIVALVHEYPGDYALRILGKTYHIDGDWFTRDKLEELFASIYDIARGAVNTVLQPSSTPPRSS